MTFPDALLSLCADAALSGLNRDTPFFLLNLYRGATAFLRNLLKRYILPQYVDACERLRARKIQYIPHACLSRKEGYVD